MPQRAYRDSYEIYIKTGNGERAHDLGAGYAPNSNTYYINAEDFQRRNNQRRTLERQKKAHKNSLISKIISYGFLSFVICVMSPSLMSKYLRSLPTGSPYPNITVNYETFVNKVEAYLANDLSLNLRTIQGAETKHPKMVKVKENSEMQALKNRLTELSKNYPTVHPAVYVWDFDDNNFVDINADEIFPAASIIKLPVLTALFRNIESGQTSIFDEMVLTDIYRAEGSGSLQYKAENSKYSIDTLARIMITHSDNSATNMLMSKIGGMPAVNREIKSWGLAHTQINNWLPDLEGTNYISARDMGQILYNIVGTNFLSNTSKEKVFSYMSHVKNDRLIPAGLGAGAEIMHKTGDIGKMLGDAGVVYAPNGKKYVVVILANRPYNSVKGKEFIVEASGMIYNYLVKI